MKLKVCILYLSLHNHLKKSFGVNRIVTRKEIYCALGRHFLVPKNTRDLVINELINFSLIKKLDRDNLQIIDYELDIEQDASQLYKLAGLF